jgi:hypothetical protein
VISALLIEVQDSLDGLKKEDGREGLSGKEKRSNVNDTCDLSGCVIDDGLSILAGRIVRMG